MCVGVEVAPWTPSHWTHLHIIFNELADFTEYTFCGNIPLWLQQSHKKQVGIMIWVEIFSSNILAVPSSPIGVLMDVLPGAAPPRTHIRTLSLFRYRLELALYQRLSLWCSWCHPSHYYYQWQPLPHHSHTHHRLSLHQHWLPQLWEQ